MILNSGAGICSIIIIRIDLPDRKEKVMFLRFTRKTIAKQDRLFLGWRSLATRNEFDSPFKQIRAKKPFIRWKVCATFFVIGSYLAYNETLFDYYAHITDTSESHPLAALQLEYKLKNLPIYEKLSHPKPDEKWIKLYSWENLDRNLLEGREYGDAKKAEDEYQKHSVHSHTLAQPGGIMIQPVIFHNLDTDECITIVHAGYKLCGYPFMVHGGMIATLLNETYKRAASLSKDTSSNLKGDFKVEDLTINYKSPTFANQFLIVKTSKSLKDHEGEGVITFESKILSEKEKLLVKSNAVLRNTGRASLEKGSFRFFLSKKT